MNLGFDLDKIFINHPPFIPSKVIDWFYRKKANGTLLYRIPGQFEQKVRVISHYPLLRPPIEENIAFIKKVAKTNNAKLFLITSRFNFLETLTSQLLKKHKLDTVFTNMYFNYKNQQPHVFKSNIISQRKIDKFVDDDLPLLQYLSQKHPRTVFFWFNEREKKKLGKNLFAITKLSQMLQ